MSRLLDAVSSFDPKGAKAADADSEDGLTADEIALRLRQSREWVRFRLRGLVAANKVIVGKRKNTDVLGRVTWTPVYRIIGDDPNPGPTPGNAGI